MRRTGNAEVSGSVGIAVSSDFLDLDEGWQELRSALIERGLDPTLIIWDHDEERAVYPELITVNYCWGFVNRREAFLRWAERMVTRTKLVNPLSALRWNSNKAYLADLAADGVPIVPTTFVGPGKDWVAPANDYVVKPSVGSGGWWAARYGRNSREAADRHVSALHAADQTVLLQPYQSSIDDLGETAMVFLGEHFSHAVHKAALLESDVGVVDALWEREVISPIEPSEAQLMLARVAMTAVTERVGETSYARVDVVEADSGAPVVLEVELVEPSLFLTTATGAGERFATVLASLIRS